MLLRLLSSISAAALACTAAANHYSGANILYSCNGGNEYTITLQLFVDCSGVPVVAQSLDFASDCGSTFTWDNILPTTTQEVSQLCPSQLANSTCNGGPLPGMELHEFVITTALSGCDAWTVSWNICCRASSINLVGNQGQYVETRILTADAHCGASPAFSEDVLPYLCVGQPVNYSFGATDADGDSLTYQLIDAQRFNLQPMLVAYQTGYTGTEPIPGITLDAATGLANFTPELVGYYIVAVRVDAFNAIGEATGSVIRDMLFVVIDCTNNNPDPSAGVIAALSGSAQQTGDRDLTLCGNASFCFDAVFTDADAEQALVLSSNVSEVLPGANADQMGSNPATMHVCWDASGAVPGAYTFNISATDDACPQPAVQSFTYTVVVSSAPNAGQNTSVTRCSTDPPPNLFALLNGNPDPNGEFTLISPGVYHYVVPGIGGCVADSSTLVITTVEAADAGLDNSIGVCANGEAILMLDSLLGTPQSGGAWTSPGGQAVQGVFDPGTYPPGVYCYTVPGIAPCPNATACLSVTLLEPNDPVCLSTTLPEVTSANMITVLPEPNNGRFSISLTEEPARVRVLDGRGRPVPGIGGTLMPGMCMMELPANSASGRYILRVEREGSVEHVPFTVIR